MSPAFDFGQFPVLMTERTSLCEYDSKYVADIFAIRSDPEVQRYNSAPHRTIEETLTFIEEERERYRMKQEIIWAVQMRESARVIGSVSLFDWDRYHRRVGIGYDLAKDCWGLGYAQEAIREVLRFAFETMAVNRIEIWTAAENLRSVCLAERLGFTLDGTLRKRILEDDAQFHDCAIFGLLHADWSRRASLRSTLPS